MICTEQERDALMAAIGRLRRAEYERGGNDEAGSAIHSARIDAEIDTQLAAIRAMLSGPDDAVLRERIANAIYRTWNPESSGFDKMSKIPKWIQEDFYAASDAILAVLQRGEATRDE